MTGGVWRVYWNEYAGHTYLYGSEVSFHARDDVEFLNERMPPGTVIKRWFSKVNYQMMRVEPSLPMIDGEGSYRISLNASADAEDGLILKLIFYDRYDVETGSQIVRDGAAEFRCPITTFSYEVQLINAGAKRFHFHSIVIAEVIDDEQRTLSDTEESEDRAGADSDAE